MSKGVRELSVIDLKTPLSVNGKLVVVIHPLRLGLVNEIHIQGYPKPLYIRGEEAGTGYAVCETCYDRELDEEERYIDELKK